LFLALGNPDPCRIKPGQKIKQKAEPVEDEEARGSSSDRSGAPRWHFIRTRAEFRDLWNLRNLRTTVGPEARGGQAMIRVPVSQLEPGMILAAPLIHPNAEDLCLLKTGYVFETYAIARVREMGIDHVWIGLPGFDFLDQQIQEAIPRSREGVYRAVKESFSGISSRTAGSFNLHDYQRVISNMILALVADNNNAVFADRLWRDEDELFAHSSNVAYLSLVIGMRIQDYVMSERKYVNAEDGRDLTNLGIGAMLHDLGKLGMDRQWHGVHRLDRVADCDAYREHAQRGYEAVRERVEATAARVLLHHHQTFDGTGFPKLKRSREQPYPEPLKGHDIHIFGRIVAVANVLDAIVSAYLKKGLPLVAALAALHKPALQGMFDPVVVDAAYRVLPPFPLGSLVKLSDGRTAVVTDLHETAPCQPVVRTIDPGRGQAGVQSEDIDLAKAGAPHVAAEGGKPTTNFLYTIESESALRAKGAEASVAAAATLRA
jgi:HD-GYP domain-containing protein (c-di-GMP phosphodiesterase class II)